VDPTGVQLRQIQWAGSRRLDEVFRTMSPRIERAILKQIEYPNGPTGRGVLSSAGRDRALAEIGTLLYAASDEMVRIIDEALTATVRMAGETEEAT
jgi:hypothetical protein